MTLPPHVLREAEKLLSQVAATTVSITRCEPLTQELSVARCSIVGTRRLPPSVIVRTHRTVGGWRTDNAYLFSDYAAASFLQRVGSRACARLIASDMRVGVQVGEDLGPGPSLDDLLASDDPAAATSALIAFAHALGDMHAITVGRAADYERLRTSLGPDDPVIYQTSLDEKPISTAWEELFVGAADRGVTADRAVHVDVERLLEVLRDPTFLVLSSGDPCPYNCRVLAGQVRFFDFELAGYRHALLDASYLRLPFPSCYRVGRLPVAACRAAERQYRETLAQSLPEILDGAIYRHGMAMACGAWAIVRTARVWTSRPSAAEHGRVQAVIDAFIRAAHQAGAFTALADWFERLASTLSRHTTKTEKQELYPAFANTPVGDSV